MALASSYLELSFQRRSCYRLTLVCDAGQPMTGLQSILLYKKGNFSMVTLATGKRILLVVLLLMLGRVLGSHMIGQAEAASAPAVAPSALVRPAGETAAIKRFTCTIKEVDEWVDNGNSVLIGCNPGDGNISFFVQPTTDPRRAARILAITLTAISLGKSIWVEYDPANTTVVGCNPSNCRTIVAMGMNNP